MDDWRSYDSVAETYERVHAHRFDQPARDLLALAGVGPGQRLLDVGTGTGIAAAAAADLGAEVIGADPSVGMLTVARRVRPSVRTVAGEAIDLPFRDGSFDVVTANFVLAHFAKVSTALWDMSRVAKTGGRLAFSAWADGRDAFTDAWLELISAVVPREMLEPSIAEAVPNRDRFRRREEIEEVLYDSGLRHVRTERARYAWTYSRDDYLDGLTTWATGRFVRGMLGKRGWDEFLVRARAEFAERFPDPLHDTREVILALGVKV